MVVQITTSCALEFAVNPQLTARQLRFVEELQVDCNASAAARRAGYSNATAYSAGQRLLKNVEVAAAIEEARRKRSEQTGITAKRVLEEIAKIAFLDPRRLFDENGLPRPVGELDGDTAAAVAGLEVSVTHNDDGSVTRIAKIKLADKLAALEKLGRHLGIFDPRGAPGSAENPIALLIKHAQGTALQVVANPPEDDEYDDGDDRAAAA